MPKQSFWNWLKGKTPPLPDRGLFQINTHDFTPLPKRTRPTGITWYLENRAPVDLVEYVISLENRLPEPEDDEMVPCPAMRCGIGGACGLCGGLEYVSKDAADEYVKYRYG